MRLTGYCVGTVSNAAETVSPPGVGKKPFLGFTIEFSDEYSKFPTRVRCMLYGADLSKPKALLAEGVQVFVQGDVSAEAYLGKTDNQPKGALKMFVKAFEVLGDKPEARTNPTPNVSPQPAEPATVASPIDNDDVPF